MSLSVPFEKTGLPEHPTLRAAYEVMLPAKGDAGVCGVEVAQMLIDTGAAADPDILGAALLIQYDEAAEGSLTDKGFSQRLADIYRQVWDTAQTSSSADPAVQLVALAFEVWVLERELKGFAGTGMNGAAIAMLENSLYGICGCMTADTPPVLKQRAEKGVAAAEKMMRGETPAIARKASVSHRLSF